MTIIDPQICAILQKMVRPARMRRPGPVPERSPVTAT